MANYIVLNSKFTPYTFQDKIAPYQEAVQQTAQGKQMIQQLEMETAKWENILSQNPNDAEALEMYKNYKEKSDSAKDYFFKYGTLNGGDEMILDVAKDYASKIVPMEDAYKRRAADIEEQRKAELQDGSIEFSRRAADTALSDYINNSTLSYNFVSKNDLYKQVTDLAKNLADQIRQDPVKYKPILGNQYYESIVNYGFSDEDIQAAINGDPLAPAPLRNIINSVLHSNDLSWANEDQFSRIYNSMSSGLWGAKGKDDYNTLANKGYNTNPTTETTTETTTYPAINPRNIYSQVDYDERTALYDNYRNYIKVNPDGSYALSDEGKKEYDRNANNTRVQTRTGWSGMSDATPDTKEFTDTEFKKFIEDLRKQYQKRYPDKKDFSDSDVLNEFWPYYTGASRYDALKETEFAYDFDSKDTVDIKNKIKHGASGMDLEVVEYDKDKGVYASTGETLASTDFAKDRYTVVGMASSSRGTIIDVYDEDKGKNLKIKLPQSIHSYAQDSLNRVWYSIDDIQKNLSKQDGEKIVYNNKEITLTQKVRDILQEDYEKLLANAYSYMGSIFGTNTTKTQEFEQNAF